MLKPSHVQSEVDGLLALFLVQHSHVQAAHTHLSRVQAAQKQCYAGALEVDEAWRGETQRNVREQSGEAQRGIDFEENLGSGGAVSYACFGSTLLRSFFLNLDGGRMAAKRIEYTKDYVRKKIKNL